MSSTGVSRRSRPPLLLRLVSFIGLLLVAASAVAAQKPTPRVAVVNCLPYHLEVLLGTVALVRELNCSLELYTYENDAAEEGHRIREAQSLLKERYGNFSVGNCMDLERRPPDVPLDAIFFVSGQEEVKFHRKLFEHVVNHLRPSTLLAIVHNTGRKSLTNAIFNAHPPSTLLALSHTSHRRLVRAHRERPRTSRLNWILPTLPLSDGTACLAAGPLCTATFAIQGNLDPKRRDFDSLFDSMAAHLPALTAASVVVKLIGAADPPFPVPRRVSGLVAPRLNLNFFHFYREVEGAIALLPLLPSADYLNGTKITSTIITSLITGVPILADSHFLAAYAFLPPQAVYLQHDGEPIAAAMLRVAALPEEQHRQVRLRLQAVRRRLDHHNLKVLQRYLS